MARVGEKKDRFLNRNSNSRALKKISFQYSFGKSIQSAMNIYKKPDNCEFTDPGKVNQYYPKSILSKEVKYY